MKSLRKIIGVLSQLRCAQRQQNGDRLVVRLRLGNGDKTNTKKRNDSVNKNMLVLGQEGRQ